jgi:hypothetical protein
MYAPLDAQPLNGLKDQFTKAGKAGSRYGITPGSSVVFKIHFGLFQRRKCPVVLKIKGRVEETETDL